MLLSYVVMPGSRNSFLADDRRLVEYWADGPVIIETAREASGTTSNQEGNTMLARLGHWTTKTLRQN
jgi:hypothetical protein